MTTSAADTLELMIIFPLYFKLRHAAIVNNYHYV